MHELAVCQSLLHEVGRVAGAHNAAKVMEVVVTVGPLSGIEAPQLVRAFTIARAGTVADDATLLIDEAPVVVWCDACETESEVQPNALLCRRCGTWRVSLKSGNELLLKRIELETVA